MECRRKKPAEADTRYFIKMLFFCWGYIDDYGTIAILDLSVKIEDGQFCWNVDSNDATLSK